MWWLFALSLVMLIVSTTGAAAYVSCPAGTTHLILEEGAAMLPDYVEQDIGGDYDETAPQTEWNGLNDGDDAAPVTLHCLKGKGRRVGVDLALPNTMKRCVARGKIFLCTSDSVACPGYVSNAVVGVPSAGELSQEISPDREENGEKIWSLRPNRSEKLAVHCFFEFSTLQDIYKTLEIPARMKECRLLDKRFICTKTPNKHDLFWPDKRTAEKQ